MEQLIPCRAPHDLDDVPSGPAEHALEFLDDLAVAANRAVETLQVAVDDPVEIAEVGAASQGDRAEGLGLVTFAVAQERPDLARAGGCDNPAGIEQLIAVSKDWVTEQLS